jgi:inosose dehydratase
MTKKSPGISLANAPVSYGAFEVTVGIDPNTPQGTAILDEVSAAGYEGIDLGPVGYLGIGKELGIRLADRNLGLAGAYLEFPFADSERLVGCLKDLDAMLDTFDSVAPYISGPPPRPTIADNGSPYRNANPGSGSRNPASRHSDDTWGLFGEGLRLVVDRCRVRGYEPTFHNETGTFVEAPEEVEKMLAVSDVGWCLDTGHFLLGGGEPVAALNKWFSRINHIHIKDTKLDLFEKIVEDKAPTTAIWDREIFPVLGQGDLKLETLVEDLHRLGFTGWAVVEQDTFPKTSARFKRAIEDQRENRKILAKLGL